MSGLMTRSNSNSEMEFNTRANIKNGSHSIVKCRLRA